MKDERRGRPIARRPRGDRPVTWLRLGTRGSPLAMTQARGVAGRLEALDDVRIEVVAIETSGDRHLGQLGEHGGKGSFVREIDRALQTGRVDLAVHSLKDVPADVPRPEGLAFAAFTEREDTSDVMLFRADGPAQRMADLPESARVGTSAVRRRAQLGRLRPDLRTEFLRGNIGSRLARLDSATGELDAAVLARVSLTRLGIDRPYETLDIVPAVGAGVLAVDCREDRPDVVELVARLDDAPTRRCVAAERAMLAELRGHCNSPIAGHARYEPDGRLSLHALVFSATGHRFVESLQRMRPQQAERLGVSVAANLIGKGARELIEHTALP